MKKNKCKRCEKFYKQFPLINNEHLLEEHPFKVTSSPVRCAFKEGKFISDSWSCETMVALRDLCEEKGYHDRDDMSSGSIGVLAIPESEDEDIQQGYLVMTWYKDRGATPQAWIMWDDEEPELLTEKTAEFILEKALKQIK